MGTRIDRLQLRRRRLALRLSLDAVAAAIARPATVLAAFEDGRDAVLERHGLSADAMAHLVADCLDAMERGEPPSASAEDPFIPAFLRQKRE